MNFIHIGNVISEKLQDIILIEARVPYINILQIRIIQDKELIKPYVLYIKESIIYLFKCDHTNYPEFIEISQVMNSKHFNYLGFFDLKKRIFFKNKNEKINKITIIIFSKIIYTFYKDNGWHMNEAYKLNIIVDATNDLHELDKQEVIKVQDLSVGSSSPKAFMAQCVECCKRGDISCPGPSLTTGSYDRQSYYCGAFRSEIIIETY